MYEILCKIEKRSKRNIKRINNVISYIEKNLDKDLNLDDLSQKAFIFIVFIFTGFFQQLSRIMNSFIIRKRVERICVRIIAVGTDKTLIDLAYKYGFDNASSF